MPGTLQDSSGSAPTIECLDSGPPEAWDEFVNGVPDGHPEQSGGWAAAERANGWDAAWLLFREAGQIVAGAQVLHRPVRRLGRIAYLRCGPLLREGHSASRIAFGAAINRWAASRGVRYFVVNLGRRDPETENEFRRAGFLSKPPQIPPRILSNATLFVDLADAPQQLMSGMRRERAREIRVACRSRLVFREGADEDLPVFYDLLRVTAERQNSPPIPSRYAYLSELWRNLRSKSRMRLFVVELDGKPLCAGTLLLFGHTSRFWRYGWNGEEAKLYPNSFLYWKLMEWSQLNGFRFFDIMQIEPVLAEKIATNAMLSQAEREHRLYGATFFKMGFGGEIVRMSETLCRFYPDWLNRMFRFSLRVHDLHSASVSNP